MIETILLARNRKTGEYVPLSDSREEFHALKAKLTAFDQETHDEYDRVGLYQLVPQKKVLKLATKKELSETRTKHAQMIKDGAELQKLAELPLDKLKALAAKLGVTVGPRVSKGELAAAVFTARSLTDGRNQSGASNNNQQPLQEPEELKGKTDDELRQAIVTLNDQFKLTPGKSQIAIAPDASRDHLIMALVNATSSGAREPGFFAKLFGAK